MARGSISKRVGKRGTSWRARIITGYRTDGSAIVAGETFARRKDAEDWLTKIRHELRTGAYVEPSTMRFADYLAHWLLTSEAGPHTKINYESAIRGHIVPALGDVALKDLNGQTIQALYNATRERAPSRARLVGSIVNAALDLAESEGLIARNPAAMLKTPSLPRKADQERVKVWTARRPCGASDQPPPACAAGS